jgi:hypothetical protein
MKFAALFSVFLAATAHAQVQGKPFGFAAGTTGGGNAKPAAPKSLQEYVPKGRRFLRTESLTRC